ncbi:MAG: hypothetical protein ABI618_05685 [Nitrospirota bacterium]
MPTQSVTSRIFTLGFAALLLWRSAGLVPEVRADDGPTSRPTAEKETSPPHQEDEVQERGVMQSPLQGLQSGATAPLQLVGPTENLTKVINALSHRHKSLTTVITTAPGLQLTQPVEISILFSSPWGTNIRLTQPYQQKFGNRFVYQDPEGEGTLRHLRMDIWLTEPKPEGGHYSYSMTWQADLDPMYDITISPLAFELRSNCDYIGNSEIRFGWAYPDAVSPSARNKFHFTTTKGKTVWIQQFGWTRTELTTVAIMSMNLHMPAILWTEHDPNPGVPFEGLFHFSVVKLPGKTQLFDFALFPDQPYPGPDQIRGNTCIARIQYRITYNLRTYQNL